MNDDQWKIINQRLDNLQYTVDVTNKDLATDRADLQQLAIRVGAVESQSKEIWKIVNSLPERTKEAVATAVKPITQETHQLSVEIAKKKFVKINIKGKAWYKKLFRKE